MFRQVINVSRTLFNKTNVRFRENGFTTSKMCMVSQPSTTNNIEEYKECFKLIGLTNKQSANLIKDHPDILSYHHSQLKSTVEILIRCQFGKENLSALVIRHPYVLFAPGSNIELTYQNLCTVFSKSVAYKVLLNAPNILNEPWSNVEDKLDYLENEMLSTKSEISKCGALNYSLDYIRIRHTFLAKVGVFKKLSPKMEPYERQKINPGLDVILNSSDSHFAKKVAGVSLWEFEVYKEVCNFD